MLILLLLFYLGLAKILVQNIRQVRMRKKEIGWKGRR